MKNSKIRITKKEWYAKGGFKNSNLWRIQSSNGGWKYYENID